ncbi:GDCCVxC domain-containing (seleno)protein [Paraburkholderia dilworthii]|uniref:GDCCVxC domain-containing (Seleno)protein n=1 Tax=Paraburkholderia dilworthii TaxID=948106 RepID=A0ABW9DEQ4_9BURK
MAEILIRSTLTCPRCAHKKAEVMPTNECRWFYECEACRALLTPLAGDCCVFCSYGSVKCPTAREAAMARALGDK